MTARVAALLAASAATVAPAALAQSFPCLAQLSAADTADRRLAERFAPVYFPMRQEIYLPTLFFFSAFDGLDNNDSSAVTEDGARDFRDPDEIAPRTREGSRLAWDSLNSWYLEAKRRHATPVGSRDSAFVPFAVAYRVTALEAKDEDRLWTFLRNDEHAWKRTRWMYADSLPGRPRTARLWTLDSVQTEMRRRRQGFTVIQYYAYYLNDVGLEGHPSDMEPVVVFVPDSVPGSRVTDREFRIVVGVGHTDYIPNGVAVLVGERATYPHRATEAAVAARPRILIEFGDHSSAPDLPPFLEFQPGWDVNWQSRFVWGTRDVQASLGIGFLGTYEFGMTFPRDSITWLYPAFMSGAVDQLRPPGGGAKAPYSLVSTDVLACLFEVLEHVRDFDERKPPTAIDLLPLNTALKALHRDLGRTWAIKDYVTAFDSASTGNDAALKAYAAAALAMAYWTADLETGTGHTIPNKKVRAWEHGLHTGSPAAAFKWHLFRPTTNAMHGNGFGRWALAMIPHPTFGLLSSGRYRVGVGVAIPAIDSPLSLPGILELNAGIYGTLFDGLVRKDAETSGDTARRWTFATWLTYEDEYGDQLTWFAQLLKIWNRGTMDGTDRSGWQVEGGLSIGLIPDPKTRMRIGPRLDLSRRLNLDWAIQFTWVR